LLIIDAELCEPPSEVVLFRDITLYSNCLLGQKVLLECDKEYRDFYYKWLKNRCAFDYVYDFVKPKSEYGISIRTKKEIANIQIESINYSNLNDIIRRLSILCSQ